MQYCLIKSEPDVWSIDQQIKAVKKHNILIFHLIA